VEGCRWFCRIDLSFKHSRLTFNLNFNFILKQKNFKMAYTQVRICFQDGSNTPQEILSGGPNPLALCRMSVLERAAPTVFYRSAERGIFRRGNCSAVCSGGGLQIRREGDFPERKLLCCLLRRCSTDPQKGNFLERKLFCCLLRRYSTDPQCTM
jgi:hypothetical protein